MKTFIAAFVVGFVIGCATVPYAPTDVLRVEVKSMNFDAQRVRLFCDRSGGQVAVIRGLTLATETKQDIRLQNCRILRILVQTINDDWLSEMGVMVDPGDVLRITIPTTLSHTTWTVR